MTGFYVIVVFVMTELTFLIIFTKSLIDTLAQLLA